jgi:rhodanese-related sulfurtransferase
MKRLSTFSLIAIISVNLSIILLSILLGVSLNKSFVRGPQPTNYLYMRNKGNLILEPVQRDEPKNYPLFEGIELEAVKEATQVGGIVLLDGRTQSEYENGHIPGAFHLAVADFERSFTQFSSRFSKSTLFIIYCRGGDCNLSRRLAEQLYDKGYKQLKIYRGGYNDWFLNGNPVEKGKGENSFSVKAQ